MIKLVATDIDGTILSQSRVFSQGVKTCIKTLQKNGIKVVLVTGRMHKGAKKLVDILGLDTPVVSYNGGQIIDKDNNVLYQKLLDENYVDKLLLWAKENNVHINFYANNTLYSENDNYEIQRYAQYQGLDYTIKSFDELAHNNVHKLLGIDYKNPNRVSSWIETTSKMFPELYIVKSTPWFCEFAPKEATKYCAVKFLQNYWGYKDDEVLTIGDQDNDIELLKAGGISVAMGNATDTLKQYSDYITDTVENDGFVKAIEKFVLNDLKEVNI